MVTWACDEIHNYILGREFEDVTDKKILVPLAPDLGAAQKLHFIDWNMNG